MPGGEALRVVRGDSWGSPGGYAGCAVRDGNGPDRRFNRLGLRLVCVSPILKR